MPKIKGGYKQKMYDVIINKKSYISPINYVEAYSISISKELDDYTFSFNLLLPASKAGVIEVGAEAFIKDNGKIVTGGILYDIEYETMDTSIPTTTGNEPLLRLKLTVDNFSNLAQRLMVKPVDVTSIDIDLNHAENLFKKYWTTYLQPYGVSLGAIKTNLTINELEEDTEEGTLKEKLDNLKELTKSEWFISYDKKFWVYNGKKQYTIHSEVIKEGSGIREVSVSKTMQDYRNRYILVGGEPTGEVSDEYINEEGRLFVQVDNTAEQSRIRGLIGGDGIFCVKEENDKLESIAEMERYAKDVLNRYGKPPITLKFETFNGSKYEAGDFITVNLPSLNISNQIFCIDSIDIEDMQDGIATLNYKLSCSLRQSNNASDNFWNMMKGNNNADSSGSTGGTKAPSAFVETVDIQVQSVISASADISFI